MPMLRWCGGTNTLASASTTARSPMLMRPPSARSRPATQRSVVVLPQPDGPSSVTISPAATSKSMPATAATVSLLALKVLVNPSTRIMSSPDFAGHHTSILLLHAETASDHIGDDTEHHQQEEHQHPEGAEQQERAFLPEVENDNR